MWGEILKRFCEDAEYRKYFCEDLYEHQWDWANRAPNVTWLTMFSVIFVIYDAVMTIIYIAMGDYTAAMIKSCFALFYGWLTAKIIDLPGMIKSADCYARR